MRKSLFSMFLGFIFVSALTLNAYAQMCGSMGGSGSCMQGGMMMGMGCMQAGGMMMDDDHPMWKHLVGLGLDEKQKEAIKALQTKTMKEMIRKKADAQIADIDLKNLLDKDPVDMKAVEATVKKSESFKTAMFLAHISAREELKSILTPDQRKRLKEMPATGHGPECMMGGDAEHKDMPMHEHMH
jgi:Spy/CpxP family protein refolding chaperone